MTDIKNLPSAEGAEFIIVDEGLEAIYAEALITGWTKNLIEKNSKCTIDMLLFAHPPYIISEQHKRLHLNNIKLVDFFSKKVDVEKSTLEKLHTYLESVSQNSIVIINCLSTLILSLGLEKTVRFLHELREKARQLIGINRNDFGSINIPGIETLGTTYLRLRKHSKVSPTNNFVYEVNYTHRKPGGSVTHKSELVTQDVKTYEIISSTILCDTQKKTSITTKEPSKEVEASFRIKMSDREMEQRKNTPLPYTAASTSKLSSIFYEPEDIEDDEEEDLDFDLVF